MGPTSRPRTGTFSNGLVEDPHRVGDLLGRRSADVDESWQGGRLGSAGTVRRPTDGRLVLLPHEPPGEVTANDVAAATRWELAKLGRSVAGR